MTIHRWTLIAALAGCAGTDEPPQVQVTLSAVTVTSVDSGQPAMDVFGTISAETEAGAVTLFDHDAQHPIPLTTGTAWPAQGVVGQDVVTIPTYLDPPYEIVLRYHASSSYYDEVDDTLTVPYEEGMHQTVGFNVHYHGGILLQLTLQEL